jgi:putative FmdB family regulatory protein
MPIYEYQCGKCGVFEISQRITEAPLKKCPTCHGKVERLISHTSFILKGSGWYATDYARSNSKSAESIDGANGSASKPESSASDSSAAAKSPPKSAEKADKAPAAKPAD